MREGSETYSGVKTVDAVVCGEGGRETESAAYVIWENLTKKKKSHAKK